MQVARGCDLEVACLFLDSIICVFSRVEVLARIYDTQYWHEGLGIAVGLVSALVCRTLGSVQDCFDASSRTKLQNLSHHC